MSTLRDEKLGLYNVIAVVSSGNGCGGKDNPGKYTRVASFIDWITRNVWPEEYNEIKGSIEN